MRLVFIVMTLFLAASPALSETPSDDPSRCGPIDGLLDFNKNISPDRYYEWWAWNMSGVPGCQIDLVYTVEHQLSKQPFDLEVCLWGNSHGAQPPTRLFRFPMELSSKVTIRSKKWVKGCATSQYTPSYERIPGNDLKFFDGLSGKDGDDDLGDCDSSLKPGDVCARGVCTEEGQAIYRCSDEMRCVKDDFDACSPQVGFDS
jgi:hypothetical protein